MALPNIHIIGIQGSGKGTQSALLVEKYHFLYLASGNLFRERAAQGDELGKKIGKQLTAGHLLPDAYLYHTIIDALNSKPHTQGILGDGVIRTIEQYIQLDPIWNLMDLDQPLLINLVLEEKSAEMRIQERTISAAEAAKDPYHLTYSGKLARRTDDNPHALRERFAIFHTMTEPLIQHFSDSNRCITIDGNRDIQVIHTDICQNIGRFYPTLHGTD